MNAYFDFSAYWEKCMTQEFNNTELGIFHLCINKCIAQQQMQELSTSSTPSIYIFQPFKVFLLHFLYSWKK